MPPPILTLGELEPERPTVAINRRTPDGAWQRFKARWFPYLDVRYVIVHELYAMRLPSEFGLADISRIQRHQREIAQLQVKADDPAASRRASRLLREVSGIILDAPGYVLDSLSDTQHIQLLLAFPAAVTGQTPTEPPPTENPSTSADSSPASAVSTAPMTG